ncbi:MAG: class I SAM-dependent DNA methyltransferase [Niveispirillum sp.]|nr:class I SAM-dependent DNA methyltransferase [Niveispirillum sp.]
MTDIASTATPAEIDAFIQRWTPSGGAELSNYGDFIAELCALIRTEPPRPTQPDEAKNTYVKEKAVSIRHPDGSSSSGRIDCYKQGCFVLEAKQGVDAVQGDLPLLGLAGDAGPRRKGHGVRGSKGWDDAMIRARGQAEKYAKALPEWPPFLIIVDVGHEIQLFAGFSRTGKDYTHFPDASSFRIRMQDLHRAEVRARLKAVWEDPMSLDPSRHAAKVTRDIADQLARLAKSLEADGHSAQNVATFLMRCLFTMFAEDVELLPKESFREELKGLLPHPQHVAPTLRALWKSMDEGGFCSVLRTDVLRFNGGLFAKADALPLTEAQLRLLIQAAGADWRDVEPAIFGTLLERALDARERHKLGAHYTPRAYVERLVLPTVIEPLREEWDAVKTGALGQDREVAVAEVRAFHERLCATRVLDPACGTGNFLYVTLELMKRLEGEVLDFLSNTLGERQDALALAGHTVDPHQFLGIEINPRAAAIAEMVIWIGYLQWHFRTFGKVRPAEPILKDFKNIENRDAILAYDRVEVVKDEKGKPVTRWDGVTMKKHPVTGEDVPDEKARVEVLNYVKPRPAKWPKADYIVGNPPFIGNKRMRLALGEGYTTSVRKTYNDLPDSIDLVMYWWDRSSRLLRSKKVIRFGFITTNSITQTYNRSIVSQIIKDKASSICFAVSDHPWVDTADGAAVRVAMTVAANSNRPGRLLKTKSETANADGEYSIEFSTIEGSINDDLSIGPDITGAFELRSNSNLANQGVIPLGDGFKLTRDQLDFFKINPKKLPDFIKKYIIGRDIMQKPEEKYIIDFFPLSEQDAQSASPAIYQHILNTIKPERQAKALNSKDASEYYRLWWQFAKPRQNLRPAIFSIPRYIVTCRTSKHRVFQYIPRDYMPDAKIVAIGLSDSLHVGILSSRTHVLWAMYSGAWLGVGNDSNYNHSDCFNKFPFPDPPDDLKQRIRDLGERLDRFRKDRQAEHADLTLTQMYNVLERLRELDRDPTAKPLDAKEKAIHDKGLISVLRQIHDDLDRAVFDAYGWPHDLSDEGILEKLVALNKERAAEEKRGLIRWLRPDFQAPKQAAPVQQSMDVGAEATAAPAKAEKQPWPKKLAEQTQAVHAALTAADGPRTARELARAFKSAPSPRVEEVLQSLVAMGKAWVVEGKEDRYAA